MIGTLICRNCDTVFEVSEGDVTKFKVHPVFNCTVCNSDLSQMMGSLVTGHSAKPDSADEFTIPDDAEVFADLPMGETFDQAAAKMRGTGTAQPRPAGSPLGDTVRSAEPPLAARPRPVTEGSVAVAEPALAPAPTPAEDPVQMALRMAKEAQAAMEAQSMAPGSAPAASEIGETTGIAIRWKPASPSAITAPVAIPVNGGGQRSTEAGVVPEEPDNEPTARGKGASEPTGTVEPTKPSEPANNAARDEMTPLLGSSQFRFPSDDQVVETADDEAIPDVPDDVAAVPPGSPEPTPAVSHADPPMEEVTIRKASAPPPLPLQGLGAKPLLVRAGNGPASVGALGIRVVVGRPIVRPVNGRAPSVASDTAISSGPSAASGNSGRYESVRTPSSGTRVPAATTPAASGPPPVAAAPAPAAESVSFDAPAPQPRLAITPPMIAAGVGAIVLVGALTIWAVHHHNEGQVTQATETPAATATPLAEVTAEVTTAVVATEPPTPRPHTSPRATVAGTATQVAALPSPTPRPSRTAVALTSVAPPVTARPATPTPAPTPKPSTPIPKQETLQALEDAKAKAALGEPKAAVVILLKARLHDSEQEALTYGMWKYASGEPPPAIDALRFAGEYLNGLNGKFTPLEDHRREILKWKLSHPQPPANP